MWKEEDKSIKKEFNFPDFKEALDFVNKVGELAEAANHHPDINLTWGKVHISLTTHDEGGVTDKDKQLAEKIDELKK